MMCPAAALHPTRLTQPRVAQYAGDDTLFESAGQYGESNVRRVELRSGRVLARTDAPPHVFAEGLALAPNNTLLQLTWKSGAGARHVQLCSCAQLGDTSAIDIPHPHSPALWLGFRYDAATLALRGSFTTDLPDGWGLTNGLSSDELLATDGSARLSTLDARTLRTKARRAARACSFKRTATTPALNVADSPLCLPPLQIPNTACCGGARRRHARASPQRAGADRRRRVGKHLVDGLHCEDRPHVGARASLAAAAGAAECWHPGGCAERHRLGFPEQAALRDGAAAVVFLFSFRS